MKTTANAPGQQTFGPPVGSPPPSGPTSHQTTRARLAARLRPVGRWLFGAGKRIALLLLGVLLVTGVAIVWGAAKTAVARPPAPSTIDDVTRLNPILVAGVIEPTIRYPLPHQHPRPPRRPPARRR